jgi:ankyrin repeat protein
VLMWASEYGHTAVVQALLDAGVDRSIRDKVNLLRSAVLIQNSIC